LLKPSSTERPEMKGEAGRTAPIPMRDRDQIPPLRAGRSPAGCVNDADLQAPDKKTISTVYFVVDGW
jgi:hypothetical protein